MEKMGKKNPKHRENRGRLCALIREAKERNRRREGWKNILDGGSFGKREEFCVKSRTLVR